MERLPKQSDLPFIPLENLQHSGLNQRQQMDIQRGVDPYAASYVMSLEPEQVQEMSLDNQAILEEADRRALIAQGNQEQIGQLEFTYPELYKERQRQLGEVSLKFAMGEQQGQPEIFTTVQGEGRNIGRPVVFARLSNCNLHCSWCDTPYTWVWNDRLAAQHDQGQSYNRSEEQVTLTAGEAVDRLSGEKLDRLVITGGEPMIQQKSLAPVINELRRRNPNQWVEIETNGTIAPNEEMLKIVDQFNVSPKLANSGNELKKRQKDIAMETFVATPKADFKFVVFGDEDLPEILGLVEKYNIPHERVFLMPEGRTEEEVKAHQQELVELCKEHNFNLTTRLHVLIWGAKRGV